MEPFITGFLEDNKYVGRPVDVMQLKDGSILVSDDWNGAVYRITYGKPKVAAHVSQQARHCEAKQSILPQKAIGLLPCDKRFAFVAGHDENPGKSDRCE